MATDYSKGYGRWVVSKWTKRDVPWFMLDGAVTTR